MHSMCATRVTRQMSMETPNPAKPSQAFPIEVLMRSRNSGSAFGSGGT